MAEEVPIGEITDLQWEAARTAFESSLDEKEGLPQDKYEQILDLLSSWDDLEPKERRERAGGNQSYWHKKFSVSEVGGKPELLMRVTPSEGAAAEGAAAEIDGDHGCHEALLPP